MKQAVDVDEPRVINPVLLIGLYSFPLLFVWFLFGKGYARSTRRAVFIFGLTPYGVMLLFLMIQWIGSALSRLA